MRFDDVVRVMIGFEFAIERHVHSAVRFVAVVSFWLLPSLNIHSLEMCCEIGL